MVDFCDEKVALSSIYGDDFEDQSNQHVRIKMRANGRKMVELSFVLPEAYPLGIMPEYHIHIEDGETVKSSEIEDIIRTELESQQKAGDLYSLFPLIESVRALIESASYASPTLPQRPNDDIAVRQQASSSISAPAAALDVLTSDVLEKILSWLDVEQHIHWVCLTCRAFASALRSRSVWSKFWERRWDSVPPGGGCTTAAFRSRYAMEMRWDTDLADANLRMSRLSNACLPISRMAWVGESGSHVVVAGGQQVATVHFNELLRGGDNDGDSHDAWPSEISLLRMQHTTGHESKVTCLSTDDNGQTLAVGLANGCVKVWSADAGAVAGFGRDDTCAAASRHHKASVTQVYTCARHGCVISASDDTSLAVWRWTEGGRTCGGAAARRRPQTAVLLRGHDTSITAMACTQGGLGCGVTVASGGGNGRCKLWDCERALCTWSVKAKSKVTALTLMRDWGGGGGELLLVGQRSGALQLYDTRTTGSKAGLVCSLVRMYSHALTNPRVTRDWSISCLWGHSLPLADSDDFLSLLDAPAVTHIDMSPNGRRIASMDASGTLSLFDLRMLGLAPHRAMGEQLSVIDNHGGAVVGRKGERYSSSLDWEASARLQKAQVFCDSVSRGGCCGLVCDSRKAVACGADDGRVVAVDLSRGKVLKMLPETMQIGSGHWHTREVSGQCSAMLWHPSIRRDTVLVGSTTGVIGTMRLPFAF